MMETREEVYEDAIRHALKRLEAGTVEECKTFLRACIERFPVRVKQGHSEVPK